MTEKIKGEGDAALVWEIQRCFSAPGHCDSRPGGDDQDFTLGLPWYFLALADFVRPKIVSRVWKGFLSQCIHEVLLTSSGI